MPKLDFGNELVAGAKPSMKVVGDTHIYVNPGHHVPQGNWKAKLPYRSGASVLPDNHVELFNSSVVVVNPDTGDVVRWAQEGKGKKAVYHRFEVHLGNEFHWTGSSYSKGNKRIDTSLMKGKEVPVKQSTNCSMARDERRWLHQWRQVTDQATLGVAVGSVITLAHLRNERLSAL